MDENKKTLELCKAFSFEGTCELKLKEDKIKLHAEQSMISSQSPIIKQLPIHACMFGDVV